MGLISFSTLVTRPISRNKGAASLSSSHFLLENTKNIQKHCKQESVSKDLGVPPVPLLMVKIWLCLNRDPPRKFYLVVGSLGS